MSATRLELYLTSSMGNCLFSERIGQRHRPYSLTGLVADADEVAVLGDRAIGDRQQDLLSICGDLYFTALLAGAALAAPPDIRAVVTATIAVSTAMNTRVRLRVGLTDILDCFLSADCYWVIRRSMPTCYVDPTG